jgi:exo-beta-1,3-glucanase (GH17 family)
MLQSGAWPTEGPAYGRRQPTDAAAEPDISAVQRQLQRAFIHGCGVPADARSVPR